MNNTDKIKVTDYGDMFAKVLQMDLLLYVTSGDYQGKWFAILKNEGRIFFYEDWYGSCSGCDWLEAERDWETGEVDAKSAIEYVGDIKPKYIFPIGVIKKLESSDISKMLDEEFEYDDKSEEIKEILKVLSNLK